MHRYTHRLKFEKKNCCFGSRLTRLANANASKANQIDAAVGDDVVGATPCEKVYCLTLLSRAIDQHYRAFLMGYHGFAQFNANARTQASQKRHGKDRISFFSLSGKSAIDHDL